MSILVGKDTRVIVQGITGQAGAFHTEKMLEYGTQVVGGVTPGKAGERVHGVPVFNTVREAVAATGANATVLFVPAKFAAGAITDAIDAALPLIVVITEGIPTLDMVRIRRRLEGTSMKLIGPNCPGLITPGACKVGIMPGYIHRPGPVAVLSRSGTLTYDAVYQLTQAGLGQSTCIGIGGDPVLGSSFAHLLPLLEADAQTEAIVLIGEIGGTEEEEAAAVIAARVRKPVFAFVAGRMAPKEKRMGHAGAIIAGGKGTAAEKLAALRAVGVTTIDSPAAIGQTVKAALGALLLLVWAGVAEADTIHLKNGNTLEGDIIRADEREVVIDVPELGRMSLTRAEIAAVEETPAAAAPAESEEVQAYVSWQDVSDQALRLYQRRQFAQAEAAAKRAMQLAEEFFGPTHSEVAKAAGLAGVILKDQGKYAEAEAYYALALRIWEGMEGSHQPTVAMALQDLADLYVLQGKDAQAEPLLYRAVTIRENLPQPADEALAAVLERYAEVLIKVGRPELARQMATRAHEIRSTP